MLKYDDKEYRNMQEQVQKNMEDLRKIFQGGAAFKLVYYIDTVAHLETAEAQEGFGAIVYDNDNNNGLYIYLKNENNVYAWQYIASSFPLPGQNGIDGTNGTNGTNGAQGPQGPRGPQGTSGINGTYVSANPTTTGTETGLNAIDIDGVKYVVPNVSDFYTKQETEDKIDEAVTGLAAMSEVNDAVEEAVEGLASVARTGNYSDLSNKPTIPAAQIQSNWTQTNSSEKDYIKNKPSIPSVSGTNDGTNWTTITINGTTKSIPSGGGSGGVSLYKHIAHFEGSNDGTDIAIVSTSATPITNQSTAYAVLSHAVNLTSQFESSTYTVNFGVVGFQEYYDGDSGAVLAILVPSSNDIRLVGYSYTEFISNMSSFEDVVTAI